MIVIQSGFDVEVEEWDDPGDYPNGVASGPLPSYSYVGAIDGQLVVELQPGDDNYVCQNRLFRLGEQVMRFFAWLFGVDDSPLPLVTGCYGSLEEYNYALFDMLETDVPHGIYVSSWGVEREGNKLTIRAEDFEAHDWEPDEPDYDPYDDRI